VVTRGGGNNQCSVGEILTLKASHERMIHRAEKLHGVPRSRSAKWLTKKKGMLSLITKRRPEHTEEGEEGLRNRARVSRGPGKFPFLLKKNKKAVPPVGKGGVSVGTELLMVLFPSGKGGPEGGEGPSTGKDPSKKLTSSIGWTKVRRLLLLQEDTGIKEAKS